ncbi:hypothetical protein [Prevotella sp. tc2-28]|uniref:hypothetical protein n=1 Tax=Prevotella sp. tc2-28 TaxID=1761888 RepID=UPI000B82F6CC|nr:hypothetical protein [Prevotella sp. tc2-28]
MKANELMIGDWVECTYWTPSKQLKVAEIRRIMDDEIKIGVYSDDLILIFRQSEVKPIPITPEILEKNGFINYTDFYMWKEESLEPIHLDNYDEDGWRLRINCDNIPCECKYVHQLQHALRLCGIEKEIVV